MSTTFTPGPWTYSKDDQFGDTRFYVAQAEGAPYTPHYSDVGTLIAETVSVERRSIQEANARLISAAPELLEALEKLLSDADSEPDGEYLDCGRKNCVAVHRSGIERARAALKKARGEA